LSQSNAVKKILFVLAGFILLLVGVSAYCAYLRDNLVITKVEAKKRYSTAASHFINWKGAEIHYTDEGAGPNVLMIHGFGGNFTNFDSLAAIMKSGYRVVRLDLPGFGLSDLPDSQDSLKDLYGSFLSNMLDTLHMDSVYVIGNSMGGWMGWELAAAKPEKVQKLVLLCSAGYDIEAVKANIGHMELMQSTLFRKLTEKGIPLWITEGSARKIRSEWETVNPDEVRVNNGIMNRQGNFQNIITLGNSGVFPDTSLIAKVTCPTLIIWGKNDVIVPCDHADRFKRDIKNSTVIVYDTCGHVPQMEYPHRVAEDVERFLSEPGLSGLKD
jgi:pimeloyl-ACP methyl ester carboxylesterase